MTGTCVSFIPYQDGMVQSGSHQYLGTLLVGKNEDGLKVPKCEGYTIPTHQKHISLDFKYLFRLAQQNVNDL